MRCGQEPQSMHKTPIDLGMMHMFNRDLVLVIIDELSCHTIHFLCVRERKRAHDNQMMLFITHLQLRQHTAWCPSCDKNT